jgi:hypothetical protein
MFREVTEASGRTLIKEVEEERKKEGTSFGTPGTSVPNRGIEIDVHKNMIPYKINFLNKINQVKILLLFII